MNSPPPPLTLPSQVAEPEQLAQVKQEIAVLRSMSSHPRVLQFVGHTARRLEGGGGRREVVLLLEFCARGTLVVRGPWRLGPFANSHI